VALVVEWQEGNNTHTDPFNGPLSGTTQVSQHQKGKTNLDFTEARDNEWQWYQLGHMQVCTSLQTDNHASTSLLNFFTGRFALPTAQPTVSKHWRQNRKEIRPVKTVTLVLKDFILKLLEEKNCEEPAYFDLPVKLLLLNYYWWWTNNICGSF